ncbi:WD40 repeat-like protein [Suillus decipiens]|nr:WD40 repeat-like protein [Suillus decipiens]
MPDGSRLFSASTILDPTIRVWDPSTWKQVGDPFTGHTYQVNAIAVNSTGTLVASASDDKHVRLWRFSDRRTIAIFKHSDNVYCVAFSMDVPEFALLEDSPRERTVEDVLLLEAPSERSINNAHNTDSTILTLYPTRSTLTATTTTHLLIDHFSWHENSTGTVRSMMHLRLYFQRHCSL